MRKRGTRCTAYRVCINEHADRKRTRTNDAGQKGDGGHPTVQQVPTKEISPVVPAQYPLRETYDKAFQTLSGVEEDITLDFINANFDLGDEDEAQEALQRDKDKETAPGFFEPKPAHEDMEI